MLKSTFSRSSTTFKRFGTTWTWTSTVKPTTPVFSITPKNGFLPLEDPIQDLPKEFGQLNDLLKKMPLLLDDGVTPGLLSKGEFGKAVEKLPLYDVSKIDNQALLMALFRDYTFAASSYLLEPCDIMNRKKGSYGLGRDVLPKQLAVPLVQIAEKIKAKPFMEYAQSYALYNYKRKDPSKPLDYDNLELIRKFSGMKSEHGFILVHVAMVRHTGDLVKNVQGALEAAGNEDRAAFNASMAAVNKVMTKINQVMEEMWTKSLPEDYIKFRTFIMGITGQNEMFPNGVLYEGTDGSRRAYRGESGANDSIIPTCDNLLQLTKNMPDNPMTSILKDFRSYRPKEHSEWVEWVGIKAESVSVEAFAAKDPVSLQHYIGLLDQRTAYPKATGGSPMATWLPNQLTVVLTAIQQKSDHLRAVFPKHKDVNWAFIEEIQDRAAAQLRVLQKDVQEYKKKFGDN
ncbi:hypothetical protein HDV03_002961 [Kappamyces sp. JEL0829]|nr:hypothetical protein HDV03_002961 [Kappamyces sp. JEL0829]